ncbi:hypothetical protein ACFRI7_03550 [Streptomyces sp. NPDC056716]|uniref:hypothetical protein n=1 Tax=Streptomyces sp. NPDC056716 TaxID=3345922 RepID=UPI0036BC9A14
MEFNEPGSDITYTMTDNSTITEAILKRDPATHHYVYGYLPPMPIFEFWQGNLFYAATPDGRTAGPKSPGGTGSSPGTPSSASSAPAS